MQSEHQVQILVLNFENLNRLTLLPARHFPASVKGQKVIDWLDCFKQNMKLDFKSVLAYIKDVQYIYLLVEVWTVCSHSTIFCLFVCQNISPFPHALLFFHLFFMFFFYLFFMLRPHLVHSQSLKQRVDVVLNLCCLDFVVGLQ